MALLIGFLLLSICFSFLCSIWEAVLLSVSPSFIKRQENENPATGELLKELKADIDKPLSAILTLNTIAHTVGAIGVGAQAGKLFGDNYFSLLGIEISYESVIASLMTLAILFLSEIVPKTIGANNWQGLAGFTARSLKILLFFLYPFVIVSNLITRMLKKDKDKSVLSKQDFAAMAEVAGETGAIEKQDYDLIKNVLQFDNLTVKDVMTPRTVMVAADESQTLQQFYDNNRPFIFSRVPVFKGSIDTITGILLLDVLLQHMIDGKADSQLADIKREATIVQEDNTLRQVFDILKEKRNHLAVVTDQFGAVTGLVTLEDIIETLLGLEIMDETDSVADLQQYARQLWEKRAKNLGLIDKKDATNEAS